MKSYCELKQYITRPVLVEAMELTETNWQPSSDGTPYIYIGPLCLGVSARVQVHEEQTPAVGDFAILEDVVENRWYLCPRNIFLKKYELY